MSMELNKANECTCPSGDGSLRWPCPAHPAEQAGGDERKLSDLGNELHNLSCAITHTNEEWAEQISSIARELWKWPDRAALAQPSPVPVGNLELARTLFEEMALIADDEKCIHMLAGALAQPSPTTDSRPAEWSSYDPTWVVDFIRNNSIFNADLIERMLEYATRPAGDVPQAEQAEAEAEAERPEVVASVVHSNPVVLGQCGPLNANDELMTVAQHAASVARWAEMFNRVEQERDAALARIEQQERTIAGMNEAHAKLAGLHEAAKAQHSVPVVTPEMVMAAMAVFRLDVSPFKSMEAALIAALRNAAAPGKEVGHE
ncbi:hypothetical protein ACSWMZ_006039 [Pseudomonas aeruginosa]